MLQHVYARSIVKLAVPNFDARRVLIHFPEINVIIRAFFLLVLSFLSSELIFIVQRELCGLNKNYQISSAKEIRFLGIWFVLSENVVGWVFHCLKSHMFHSANRRIQDTGILTACLEMQTVVLPSYEFLLRPEAFAGALALQSERGNISHVFRAVYV